jgi:hypothetical protein
MAYDIDGSRMFAYDINNATTTEYGSAALAALNDNTNSGGISFLDTPYDYWVGIFFPQLRDVAGYFLGTYAAGVGAIEASVDATSMTDGTWSEVAANAVENDNTFPFRTAIQTFPVAGIKAMRFRQTGGYSASTPGWRGLHLYGSVSGAEPPRLVFWDPVLDQPLSAFNQVDLSTVGQLDVVTYPFRLKNLDGTFSATSVVVYSENTGVATTDSPWLMSLDGSTYLSSVTVGLIAPGAVSNVLYARQVLASNAALGDRSIRLRTSTLLWT